MEIVPGQRWKNVKYGHIVEIWNMKHCDGCKSTNQESAFAREIYPRSDLCEREYHFFPRKSEKNDEWEYLSGQDKPIF